MRIQESSGVKVLSENMASQNKNCDIKDRQRINLDSDALFNEFQKILSPESTNDNTARGNESNE